MEIQKLKKKINFMTLKNILDMAAFEPTTLGLQVECSTTELHSPSYLSLSMLSTRHAEFYIGVGSTAEVSDQ